MIIIRIERFFYTNLFAEIIPHRPLPFGTGLITFSVPSNLRPKIQIGQIVEIPLRGQREKGIIMNITEDEPDFETLDIGRIRTPSLLFEQHFEYLRRISEYNFCSYSKVLPLFLPEKLWNSDGLPPTQSFLALKNVDANPDSRLQKSRGSKQKIVLELLRKHGGKMPETELRQEGNASSSVINNMLEKGIIRRVLQEVVPPSIPETFPNFPKLTDEQESVFRKLLTSRKSLLFGPPHSGKTLLALRHIANVIRSGKTALFLMPERFVSQAILGAFEKYFPREIFELYHSFLSDGEKQRIWWRVEQGHTKVIFGTRAALFLPFRKLGLVVLDEEQDTSFKSDQTPRYHARTAAEILAEVHQAKLVLQSATPSFESFYRAKSGEIDLCQLRERFQESSQWSTVQSSEELSGSRRVVRSQQLSDQKSTANTNPPIYVVDLRNELAAKNFSPLSRLLQQKISEALRQKKQILLFLNRRGKHAALICRQCGEAIACRHCHNRTTIHAGQDGKQFLLCHHCGHIDAIPAHCLRCNSTMLKGFGMGTQELEQEVRRLFPEAKILRADRDSTAKKNASREIFSEFATGNADILLGTQIITKGLDMPNVGLVGIVLADTTLHLPDFRATEYAFQLLTQVSGRIGSEGEVVLQTYLPEHPAVRFCRQHDYRGFYEQEMTERKALYLPPVSEMIRLIFVHPVEKKTYIKAEQWKKKLEQKWKSDFPKEHFVISLAPAMNKKQFNKFHYHVFLVGREPERLLEGESLGGVRVDRDAVESF